MAFLAVFGDDVEEKLRPRRYLLLYLLSGLVATLAQSAATPHSRLPLIGASGAIAGVLGAFLVLFPRAKLSGVLPLGCLVLPLHSRAYLFIPGWFVLQLASALMARPGTSAGTAWYAHLASGRSAAGLAATAALGARIPPSSASGAIPRGRPSPAVQAAAVSWRRTGRGRWKSHPPWRFPGSRGGPPARPTVSGEDGGALHRRRRTGVGSSAEDLPIVRHQDPHALAHGAVEVRLESPGPRASG
jgi:hypothetical protein